MCPVRRRIPRENTGFQQTTGTMCTAIRAKYGEIFILPQCAAAGDISPRILHYKKAQARRFRLKYGEIETEMAARQGYAERISQCFDEVYSWAKKRDLHLPAITARCGNCRAFQAPDFRRRSMRLPKRA